MYSAYKGQGELAYWHSMSCGREGKIGTHYLATRSQHATLMP